MSDPSPCGSADDPSVAPVEAILDRVATHAATPSVGDGRLRADRALVICACVTSLGDAPTWLIYDKADGTLRWCRIPDGSEPEAAVDARLAVGGHADPASVLDWLRGDALLGSELRLPRTCAVSQRRIRASRIA